VRQADAADIFFDTPFAIEMTDAGISFGTTYR